MKDDRYILVIADKSDEMHIALEYACARSKKTGRKIIIATFIEPLDVLTTQGVTEIMKNEAREEAESEHAAEHSALHAQDSGVCRIRGTPLPSLPSPSIVDITTMNDEHHRVLYALCSHSTSLPS